MYDTNEIYHHGILGQKWGKKNGPPYPLGSEDHSASEKKAGWRKSLGGGSESESKKMTSVAGSRVKEFKAASNSLKETKGSGLSKRQRRRLASAAMLESRAQSVKDNVRIREEIRARDKEAINKAVNKVSDTLNAHLTDNQKKSAAVVAGVLATKSFIDTVGNYRAANELMEGYAKLPVSRLVTAGTLQAGKVAAVGALATVGAMKVVDLARSSSNSNKKNNSSKNSSLKTTSKEVNITPVKAQKINSAASDLFKKSKNLREDFVDPSQIDDWDYFEYVAREEYGLNTDSLKKALK